MSSETSVMRFCRFVLLFLSIGAGFGCGSGGGGSASPGGPGTGTTPKTDSNPPHFLGLTSLSVQPATGFVELAAKDEASDDQTPQDQIVYLIYVATTFPFDRNTVSPVSFTGANACKNGSCVFELTDLIADGKTTYWFASHAQDAAGNLDQETHAGETSALSAAPLLPSGTGPAHPKLSVDPVNSAQINPDHQSNDDAVHPSVTLFQGAPYVIWEECANVVVPDKTPAPSGWTLDHPCDISVPSQIYMARLNANGAWELVKASGGANRLNDANVHSHSPTLTSDGNRLYASWREFGQKLNVKSFDGMTWTDLNSALSGGADRPALTRHSALGDHLGIAYEVSPNGSNHNDIFFGQWNGTAWTAPGSPLNIDSAKTAEAASFSRNGADLYIAWKEIAGANSLPNIFVKKWDGSAWGPAAGLGGSLNMNPANEARFPSVDVLGNNPYVAWHECLPDAKGGCGGRYIFVKHWDGAEWVQDKDTNIQNCPDPGACLGSLNQTSVSAEPPSLTVLGSRLFVSWAERHDSPTPVYVIESKSWNGGQWSLNGTRNNDSTKDAHSPVLYSDNASHTGLYVAWVEKDGTGILQLHVQ